MSVDLDQSRDGEWHHKVVLVTGGTAGIGRETAIQFAKAGARVVVAGRRAAEGQETVELARSAGGEAIFVKCDVSKLAEVEALVQKTVEAFGRLDVAFNNAGIEGGMLPITEITEDDWDNVIDGNLKSIWLCLKYEIRQMLKQGDGGAIVNMASIGGAIGKTGSAPYIASKHGVVGLTKTAAMEYAADGIRVNVIGPSVVEGPMVDRIFTEPAIKKLILDLHPIGRIAKPSEIADTVMWLSSSKSSFVTGQFLVLDGGMLVGPSLKL